MGKGINLLAWVLTVLAVIGSIAWGVFGITRPLGEPLLLVDAIFRLPWLANTIYIIVGLVGLSLIPTVWAMARKRR